MRIEEITENDAHQVIVTVSADRVEATESNALNWHQECQIVKGVTVVDLLEEAARRLDESDYGEDWSRACQLKDLAREIRREQAVEELANRHADAAGEVWAKRFEKQGGQA